MRNFLKTSGKLGILNFDFQKHCSTINKSWNYTLFLTHGSHTYVQLRTSLPITSNVLMSRCRSRRRLRHVRLHHIFFCSHFSAIWRWQNKSFDMKKMVRDNSRLYLHNEKVIVLQFCVENLYSGNFLASDDIFWLDYHYNSSQIGLHSDASQLLFFYWTPMKKLDIR